MITRTSIREAVARAVEANEPSSEDVVSAVTESIMRQLKSGLEDDGLIVTEGGGPHLLAAIDKTVWRAEPVAGVAAHVDPDSPIASGMIVRRFARRT